MIVLDASAALAYFLRLQPEHEWLRTVITRNGQSLHAPHVIDLEVVNALRRQVHLRSVSRRLAEIVLTDFQDLDLTRYPHVQLLDRISELRGGLTAYDAAYIALAEALDVPLLTSDAALASAKGHRARIESYSG